MKVFVISDISLQGTLYTVLLSTVLPVNKSFRHIRVPVNSVHEYRSYCDV